MTSLQHSHLLSCIGLEDFKILGILWGKNNPKPTTLPLMQSTINIPTIRNNRYMYTSTSSFFISKIDMYIHCQECFLLGEKVTNAESVVLIHFSVK